MNVIVLDEDEEIFNGSADEFLEENEYDTELESLLNNLDTMKIGDSVEFTSYLGQTYVIEKIDNTDMVYSEVELCYMQLMEVTFQQNRF